LATVESNANVAGAVVGAMSVFATPVAPVKFVNSSDAMIVAAVVAPTVRTEALPSIRHVRLVCDAAGASDADTTTALPDAIVVATGAR
jgi:hypothetical protein